MKLPGNPDETSKSAWNWSTSSERKHKIERQHDLILMPAKRPIDGAMQRIHVIIADVRANIELLHGFPVDLKRFCGFPVHSRCNGVIVGRHAGAVAQLVPA